MELPEESAQYFIQMWRKLPDEMDLAEDGVELKSIFSKVFRLSTTPLPVDVVGWNQLQVTSSLHNAYGLAWRMFLDRLAPRSLEHCLAWGQHNMYATGMPSITLVLARRSDKIDLPAKVRMLAEIRRHSRPTILERIPVSPADVSPLNGLTFVSDANAGHLFDTLKFIEAVRAERGRLVLFGESDCGRTPTVLLAAVDQLIRVYA